MSAHDRSQQELRQGFKGSKAIIEARNLQEYQRQVEELRYELTAARAEIRNLRGVPQAFPQNFAADDDEALFVRRESHDSFSDSDQDSPYCTTPSIHQGRKSAPAAPGEEALRRYATTIAYSSYKHALWHLRPLLDSSLVWE